MYKIFTAPLSAIAVASLGAIALASVCTIEDCLNEFLFLDNDANGYITGTEFLASSCFPDPSPELFLWADVNYDQVLSEEEWVTLCEVQFS